MKKKIEVEKPAAVRSLSLASSLRERAMIVKFATGRWYGRGADEEVVRDIKKKHDVTVEAGTFTKRFMARHRLAAIDSAVNDARKIHKRMTLRWGEHGERVLDASMYFEYKREMTACEMRFHAAVKEFIGRFDEFVSEEKKNLKTLFKDGDYPTKTALEARFYWKLNVEEIPDAEDFRVDLGAEEVARIKKEIAQEVSEGLLSATTEVWDRLYELVDKVNDRLSSSDAQVRSVIFENLKDLISLLPKLNVAGDPKLAEMSDRIMKELLAQAPEQMAESVRDDDKLRGEVAKKADKILSAMKSFTGQKGA